jgi:hypothetical protein
MGVRLPCETLQQILAHPMMDSDFDAAVGGVVVVIGDARDAYDRAGCHPDRPALFIGQGEHPVDGQDTDVQIRREFPQLILAHPMALCSRSDSDAVVGVVVVVGIGDIPIGAGILAHRRAGFDSDQCAPVIGQDEHLVGHGHRLVEAAGRPREPAQSRVGGGRGRDGVRFTGHRVGEHGPGLRLRSGGDFLAAGQDDGIAVVVHHTHTGRIILQEMMADRPRELLQQILVHPMHCCSDFDAAVPVTGTSGLRRGAGKPAHDRAGCDCDQCALVIGQDEHLVGHCRGLVEAAGRPL